NLEQRRQEILDENTDTVGLAFLGMTFGCARCHDHKYDPISQRDYFRLQSFFAGVRSRDLPLADAKARQQYEKKRQEWEAATKAVREDIDKLLASKAKDLRKGALERFHPDIQACVNTPAEKRTPFQMQIALTAQKQIDKAGLTAPTRLDA